MTERFCKVCSGWHSLDAPWPHNCITDHNWTRSDLPAPMVIIDTMGPVQSMLDGKLYDSKSELRRTYRQAGVVEVGNDAQRYKPKPKAKIDRRQIRDTLQKAKARFERGERVKTA